MVAKPHGYLKSTKKLPLSVIIKGFVSFSVFEPELVARTLLESVSSIKSRLISVRRKRVIRIPNV